MALLCSEQQRVVRLGDAASGQHVWLSADAQSSTERVSAGFSRVLAPLCCARPTNQSLELITSGMELCGLHKHE